ncbi:MAG: LapA family protein [Fischerella sp.]|nr:LapA family protein [Fischerella sp.]
MKTFAILLTTMVLAFWVMVVALLSVQNATPVSLRFLTFQSIQIPVGLVLAFFAGMGMIGMALLQPLWALAGSQRSNSTNEDDAEFFVDDEDI